MVWKLQQSRAHNLPLAHVGNYTLPTHYLPATSAQPTCSVFRLIFLFWLCRFRRVGSGGSSVGSGVCRLSAGLKLDRLTGSSGGLFSWKGLGLCILCVESRAPTKWKMKHATNAHRGVSVFGQVRDAQQWKLKGVANVLRVSNLLVYLTTTWKLQGSKNVFGAAISFKGLIFVVECWAPQGFKLKDFKSSVLGEPIIWQQMLSCLPTTLAVEGVMSLKRGKTNPLELDEACLNMFIWMCVWLQKDTKITERKLCQIYIYIWFFTFFWFWTVKVSLLTQLIPELWFFFLGSARAPLSTPKQALLGRERARTQWKGFNFFRWVYIHTG
jgi:hypothetical protein